MLKEPLSSSPLSGLIFSPFSVTKTSLENIFEGNQKQNNLETNFTHLLQGNEFTFSPLSLPSPSVLSFFEENALPKLETITPMPVPQLKQPPSKKERDTKKAVSKKVEKVEVVQPLQQQVSTTIEDRDWKITFVNEKYIQGLSFNISCKTRCEQPSSQVPEVLYSSLKYEIKQEISASMIKDQQFILGRISVVDSQGKSASLNDKGNLLKGLIECALTKGKQTEEFEGTMKAQFVDCSYHHKKGDFCWQLSYYLPSDLENSILSIQSAPFKVFARKPTAKKRKNSNFEEFTTRLEDLVKMSKKLKTEEEKKIALELVTKKFMELDPEFFKNHQF